MQIVQHDCFEWLQEYFLVAKVFAFFFFQELVSQLSQRVDCVNNYVQVFVRTNPSEMLCQSAPDVLPLEPYSIHV